MRIVLILFALALSASLLRAAPPLSQPESGPTSTVPPAAADAGKGRRPPAQQRVHQGFRDHRADRRHHRGHEKNDGPDTSALDDLFFQEPQDENAPRRGPRSSQPIQSEGSGFIVRPDGFIYTNYHVVEGADQIDVKLKDGREFKAKVVGTDEKTDIAVIKIDATNLPVAQFADSDAVRVGQFAFAIGAPFKLDYTFTYGVISGKGRSKLIATGGYSISDYLQTDASINPGNSGGPLCDIDGKVVGGHHGPGRQPGLGDHLQALRRLQQPGEEGAAPRRARSHPLPADGGAAPGRRHQIEGRRRQHPAHLQPPEAAGRRSA